MEIYRGFDFDGFFRHSRDDRLGESREDHPTEFFPLKFITPVLGFFPPSGDYPIFIWVCLKIGYIPNEIAI